MAHLLDARRHWKLASAGGKRGRLSHAELSVGILASSEPPIPGGRSILLEFPRSAFVASDFDEKTRVTQVIQGKLEDEPAETGNDCLVVIYTKEPTLLGKRFVLDASPHARRPRRRQPHRARRRLGLATARALRAAEQRWWCVDDGTTNGTYVNDEQISREARSDERDRVKIGPTIFKFLSGADVEAQYHEEIYRMTIIDGLTQIHNKRYLFEALDKEIIRARRHERDLSFLMFDIDHFKQINDVHGHLAGDFVLKELARIVQQRIRRDEVFARYGGEEFAIILPETSLEGARALAEALREKVAEQPLRRSRARQSA